MNHRVTLNGRMGIYDWLVSLISLFPATRVNGVWLGFGGSGKQAGEDEVHVTVWTSTTE